MVQVTEKEVVLEAADDENVVVLRFFLLDLLKGLVRHDELARGSWHYLVHLQVSPRLPRHESQLSKKPNLL